MGVFLRAPVFYSTQQDIIVRLYNASIELFQQLKFLMQIFTLIVVDHFFQNM